ncbi:hypothetical protein ABEB36_002596 [Hypothenemus hampei]|uniref:Leucine-rich repeat domain, L domain-containing protein n=1 Tax=Hypothenemus hampei TaxID=57062 RepID=A0ABD1F8X9_HYPHA
MGFIKKNLKYKCLFQQLKYLGTKHLTLKQCHFIDKDKTLNCNISLPQLKTLDIEECCDLIIHYTISISPNLEELKVKFSIPRKICNCFQLMSLLFNLENKGIMDYHCFRDASSRVPWNVPVRILRTTESLKSLSITCYRMIKEHTQFKSCVNLNKLEFIDVYNWNPSILLDINNLVTLNLIKCNVPESLEQVLSQCNSLKYLTIVPSCSYQLSVALHYNSIILKCAHHLCHSLKVFTWGFTDWYLRMANNFYTNFRETEFYTTSKVIEWIPIKLDVSQTSSENAPFVEMELLEQHLNQQNWSASVNVCKMNI